VISEIFLVQVYLGIFSFPLRKNKVYQNSKQHIAISEPLNNGASGATVDPFHQQKPIKSSGILLGNPLSSCP
jgi:hypothetical protein